MDDHHLSLLPFFFLLDLFILPRYVHPHFSSDFEPCANKRSGVLDFCVLHFLCFFFFLLFILWEHLALFGNSSLSKNLRGKAMITSAASSSFFILTFIHLLSALFLVIYPRTMHGLLHTWRMWVSGARSVGFPSTVHHLLFLSTSFFFATGCDLLCYTSGDTLHLHFLCLA